MKPVVTTLLLLCLSSFIIIRNFYNYIKNIIPVYDVLILRGIPERRSCCCSALVAGGGVVVLRCIGCCGVVGVLVVRSRGERVDDGVDVYIV